MEAFIGYKHTQIGFVIIVMCGGMAFYLTQKSPGMWVWYLPLYLITALFSTLTVKVEPFTVDWYFGPYVLQKSIAIQDIKSVGITRQSFWQGYGIRFLENGRLYNVSGLQSVQIILKDGSEVRLGTDEPTKLYAAIEYARTRLENKGG